MIDAYLSDSSTVSEMLEIRNKNSEKLVYETVEQRDINAAHILVELANCAKNELQSFRRSRTVFQVPDNMTNVLPYGNRQVDNRLGRDGKMEEEANEKLGFPLSKTNHVRRKQKKRKVENNIFLPHSKRYRNQCISEEEEDDGMHEMKGLSYRCGLTSRLGRKRRQNVEAFVSDSHDRLGRESLESKKMKKKKKKKKKAKANDTYKKLIHEPTPLKKKSVHEALSVVKTAKRLQFPVITPTLHTGFSFSVIHLLSAVRKALVTPCVEDFTSALGEHLEEGQRRQNENVNALNSCENSDIMDSEHAEEKNLPSLTIHEIVWRVRLKPGDPCILETREPLLDLVRGVLKIFSSRKAPLGAKFWKPFTTYAKSSKKWSWIGPLSFDLSSDEPTKVKICPKSWGVPRETLIKMVNCFANWLVNDQDALKQIGCLPSPPVTLMQPLNSKERFKDLRAHRSSSTISPSSEEVRTYFHREETLRYLIPERAFSYTTLDGRKSTVAPLRSCSGKPSARARDHFMLKNNRPPHVTVLCLVRDAAARLPGSIGTRADVCTLIRDSQYIVDDISDLQVNQVVSGALDRLHYELDPCVKYNRDRHLWVYLHGDREEEDFEIDATCSTRRCKLQGEMEEDSDLA